jgi:hypothetical protein
LIQTRTETAEFGNHAFETELLGYPEQLVLGALQFFGKPDIFRRFLENIGQQFTPSRERFIAQVFAIQEMKIEDVIDQRHALLGAFINLKQLK